jgi:hypothetical protein
VRRELLRDFLYGFVAFVKARKLYPAGHARPAKQLAAWLETTRAILERVEEVGVFVSSEFIAVCGERFGRDDRVVAEFAPELVKRLIRFLAVHRGVEAEALAILAEPLLVTPEVLRERGGARLVVVTHGHSHVLIIEFDYNMEEAVSSEEGVKIVRTLAQYAAEGVDEHYVMQRMAELGIGAEERAWLSCLLFSGEIKDRMHRLNELLTETGGDAHTSVHSCDVLLSVAHELAAASKFMDAVSEGDGIAVAGELIDRLTARMTRELDTSDADLEKPVLDQLARRLMSGPKGLLRCIGEAAADAVTALAERPAELLQVIFSRVKKTSSEIKIGDEVFETLKASGRSPEGAPVAARIPKEWGVDTARLAGSLAELRERVGSERFRLAYERVPLAHFDVLVDLVAKEGKAQLRERLVKELRDFLDRQLVKGMGEGRVILARRLAGNDAPLTAEELAQVLQSPSVLRQALCEFLGGELAWRPVLTALAAKAPSSVAAAFGRAVLTDASEVPLVQLQDFIDGFRNELVTWIERRLTDRKNLPPLERLVDLAMACRTVRVVSLVHQFLGKVDSHDRWELMRAMVEIDEARAVGAMSLQLNTADATTRSAIIRMLARIKHPLAEDTLIDVAGQPCWHGDRLEDRLAALEALGQRGTAKAREVLGTLAGNWLLLFTRGRRRVRAKAREALGELRRRLG